MPDLAALAHRFRFLILLRASLLAGAAWAVTLAALLALLPAALARAAALPLPAHRLYPAAAAVLLAMLAVLYALAARDPRRYSGIVRVAIGGRLVTAAVLAVAAAGRPAPLVLAAGAAVEAGLGLAHLAFWWPVHRG